MIAAIPEITIKDETNEFFFFYADIPEITIKDETKEFDDKKFKDEYEQIQ
jgi:hypothetical protein